MRTNLKTRIRTKKRNGQIYFCVADICTAMGLKNSSSALSRVAPEECISVIENGHRKNYVSEDGFTRLVLTSRSNERKDEMMAWLKAFRPDVAETIKETPKTAIQQPEIQAEVELLRRLLELRTARIADLEAENKMLLKKLIAN